MNDIEVNMEANSSGNNVSDIITHVKSLASGQKKSTGNRQVRIGVIAMKNITAKIQRLTSGGGASDITVKIPEINLQDVSGEGVTVGDVIAQVFPAIVAGVLEKGKDEVPAELARQLRADVAGGRTRRAPVPAANSRSHHDSGGALVAGAALTAW